MDKDPRKVNLGVGAYRDEQGKAYILPSVKKVGSATHFFLLPILNMSNYRQRKLSEPPTSTKSTFRLLVSPNSRKMLLYWLTVQEVIP